MGTSGSKDAFDQWWEWATKPAGSSLSIPAEIHNVVMTLTAEQRKDRELVIEAVRMGCNPLQQAGGADRSGVPGVRDGGEARAEGT